MMFLLVKGLAFYLLKKKGGGQHLWGLPVLSASECQLTDMVCFLVVELKFSISSAEIPGLMNYFYVPYLSCAWRCTGIGMPGCRGWSGNMGWVTAPRAQQPAGNASQPGGWAPLRSWDWGACRCSFPLNLCVFLGSRKQVFCYFWILTARWDPNININLFMARRLFFALFYKLSLWLCSSFIYVDI